MKILYPAVAFAHILCNVDSKALIGDFQFENEFDFSLLKTENYEKVIGSSFKFSVVTFFTGMCPAIDESVNWYTTTVIRAHLSNIWNSSSIPVMTWQPACYDPFIKGYSSNISPYLKTPDTFIRAIGNGTHDIYLKSVANELKLFLAGPDGVYGNGDDRRIYIRLGHEMNGAWYPWSVAYNKYITTMDYKSMWMRTREVFNNILNQTVINNVITSVDQSARIQFIWNPNNFDTGGVTAEEYYPGDEYVDSLGLDVYNGLDLCYGIQRKTAAGLMIPMILRFQNISVKKPIVIPEFGCDYAPANGVDWAGTWYKSFFATAEKYGLSMLAQFNFGPNSVYGNPAQPDIPMYTSLLRNSSSWLVHADTSLPRLVSDTDFKGSPSNIIAGPVDLTDDTPYFTGPCFYKPPTYAPTVSRYPPTPSPSMKPSSYFPTIIPSRSPSIKPSKATIILPANASGSSGTTSTVYIAVAVSISVFLLLILYCIRPTLFSCSQPKKQVSTHELLSATSEKFTLSKQPVKSKTNTSSKSPREQKISKNSTKSPKEQRKVASVKMTYNDALDKV